MTERDETYTPSRERVKAGYVEWRLGRGGKKYPDEYEAEFDRMIEAVRQEERDKAARVAESVKTNGWDGLSAKERIAARIREQGKGQDR